MTQEQTNLTTIQISLQHNEVGLFPCDTVWGLIGQVSNSAAEKIITIKNRPLDMGFVVLIPTLSHLHTLCEPLSPDQLTILNTYWPGPITFILPKATTVPDIISGGKPTIAIRYPKNDDLITLMKQLDAPLISSSANLHNDTTPRSWEDIAPDIRETVRFSYKTEQKTSDIASTIVNLTQSPPTILRQGNITFEVK
ncbi:threonylcarbamoyl-AMP synthase [Candidatus Marinamargulisbacteria bacterium SCGC AG-439-L15]|nr:threonylcarbamoyl-AMP synthase [Candidatus Marinamargulisbacteria bacterium SCGC AG-439-L15]